MNIRDLMAGMLLLLTAGSSMAGGQQFGSEAPDAKQARVLDYIADMNCPQGIEHYLPGAYYYCVGRKALARKDPLHARTMFETAAGWGSKQAQFMLGLLYFNGEGMPKNRPLGIAWLRLSSERDTPYFIAVTNSAITQSTLAERTAAAELLVKMRPVYGDARAAVRASRRYEAFRSSLLADAAFGAGVCIAGLTTSSNSLSPIHRDSFGQTVLCQERVPVAEAVKRLDTYADSVFDRWEGRVTVGPAQSVPGPPR